MRIQASNCRTAKHVKTPMTTSVLRRFLDYVTIDTTPDEQATTSPTTPGQLVLLKRLADELNHLRAADVTLDAHGVLMATIPATTSKKSVPTIGFIAHVDTSPEMPGAGVRPLVHEHYAGQDLVLPDGDSILRADEDPILTRQRGT